MTRGARADHGADRAARDSLRQQIAFLGMAERPKFTEDVRMCAAGCILAMSGKLEEMEVE